MSNHGDTVKLAFNKKNILGKIDKSHTPFRLKKTQCEVLILPDKSKLYVLGNLCSCLHKIQ